MPTGYTGQALDKGMDFEQFALLCARAFGACITLRDEPMGSGIPDEFKPSAYHIEAKATAEKELARLKAMTPEQRTEHGKRLKADSVRSWEGSLAQAEKDNGYFSQLRRHIERWEPPTPDHQGLKDFMLQQVDVSIEDADWLRSGLANAKAKSPQVYYQDAVESAARSVTRHTEWDREERDRAKQRTGWVRDLRRSLGI